MIELEIFTDYAKAKAVCYILLGLFFLLAGLFKNKLASIIFMLGSAIVYYNLPKFVVPKAAAIEMLYKLGVAP
mgnify:CR=1 FL=1